MTTIAYFDCFNGAAGDMIVGALLDAGASLAALREGLSKLPVTGYEISATSVTRQGLGATQFVVSIDKSAPQPHRHLADVYLLIDQAGFPDCVAAPARRIFERLAEAEARVHRTTVDRVHFHEVGAVDALVDVVGAVWALHLLGVDQVVCSPLPVGSGEVNCAHGVLPVPAPATAEMLKGVPMAPSEERFELTTPTGAAILTTLAEAFGPIPSMRVASIGYGAGRRESRTRANVLRVLIGLPVGAEHADDAEVDEVAVLETNLDDAAPQIVAHCLNRLLEEGALDAYSMPIQMKKSRAGLMLGVLCRPADVNRLEGILFAETGTLGIRRVYATRTVLPRRRESVETPYGIIPMKVGARGDLVTATPEFEACKEAARRRGVALVQVIRAAQAAWMARQDGAR